MSSLPLDTRRQNGGLDEKTPSADRPFDQKSATTPSQHPTRVMAVANWFLETAWRCPQAPPCSPLKLHKLAYYAQGWYLGNTGSELFPEDVEAWPHGPVVRALYPAFHRFGNDAIDRLGRHLEIHGGIPTLTTPRPADGLGAFLERLWTVYGHRTAVQLSNMTHRDHEPWTVVARHHGYALDDRPTIPTDVMRAAFAVRLHDLDNPA